jgi:MFS transporter, MHS family, proline/betaine transporter
MISEQARRRVVLAGVAGNVMEWYDFAVYGYLARTIGSLYFPADSQTARLLAAFGVFAVGFMMRPLGAVLFGFIGDRVGRGPALLWSVIAMAVPTFAMGLLPTYADIGYGASVLMVLCRMTQGLAVGGEFTGSAVFLAETSLPGRRGLASAWAPFGAVAGILLGSAVSAAVLNVLPFADVLAWGWRIPFLLGVLVGGAGFILRRRLSIDQPAASEGFPLAIALKRQPAAMLQAVALSLANAIGFYLMFVYIVSWLGRHAQVKASRALEINSINMAVMLVVILTAAALSDRIGRRPVLATAAAGLLLLSWPLLALMQTGQTWAVFLGQFGFALLVGSFTSVNPIAICEIFPRNVRCSAVSAAYNLTLGLVGGTAPVVATWLIEQTQYPLAPALYLMLGAALSLVSALLLRDPYSRPLHEEVPAPSLAIAEATRGS